MSKPKPQEPLDTKPHQPVAGAKAGGKPAADHPTAAEQVREAAESVHAKDAEASIRARMVKIGRGNQQAGRQK